ncbi:MAG TPA: MOP flippase family protein [Rhizomicrobium sp.]
MTLRQQVLHGVSWNFASRLGSQFFQVAFSVVLARLLSPREFGVVGMLLVFTGFAQALADGGLSSALIYRQDATEVHQSTVFWMQVGAGAVLSLLFYCGAPAIAAFYGIPLLEPLSRLVAWTFIIQALGLVQSALLMKQFRFKAVAAATLGSTVLSGVAAVLLAKSGYGIWALAWQGLVSISAMTILLWLLSEWRPRFVFDRAAARDMGSYGIYLLGYGSLNYWLRNGTNLLIGKAIGAHGLGIFSRAYTLMLLPLNNVSAVFGQVLFPALVQVQNDMPRFRQHYMMATRLIALVTFPLMVGVAALAEPLILLLLGRKWAEVIPILQILSFVGLFQSIIHPTGSAYNALGKTKALFHLTVLLTAALLLIMVPALRLGIVGVTYAYAAWTLLAGYLNLRLVGRYMETSAWTILASLAQIAAIAGVMGLMVFAVDSGPAHDWPFAARLVVGFLVGVSTYVALCVTLRNGAFADFTRLVSDRFGLGASPRWAK